MERTRQKRAVSEQEAVPETESRQRPAEADIVLETTDTLLDEIEEVLEINSDVIETLSQGGSCATCGRNPKPAYCSWP